jgi:cytidylate kinase
VGRALAAVLDCPYLDTGLMYRALTWVVQREGLDPTDADAVAARAARLQFNLQPEGAEWTVVLNGMSLREGDLRTPAVDSGVSRISSYPAVRHHLVEQQRALARDRCIVMLGRDIGTVVLPDAPVKLYVTASPEVRAQRRHLERRALGQESDEKTTLAEIRTRDAYDTSRPISPLQPAPDALIIHTDDLTIEQAVDCALARIAEVLGLTAKVPHG